MSAAKTPIAQCFLKIENDPKNVCYLYSDHLQIIIKDKKTIFDINWIQSATIKTKIYLMPIVFGGIIAALAGVGIFTYFANPWLLISILFVGLFLIFYGYVGGTAITIQTPIKEYDFFIIEPSPNIKAFLAFVRQHVSGTDIRYFIHTSKENFLLTKRKGYLEVADNGLQLTHSARPAIEDQVNLELLTDNLPFEIKYVDSPDQGMVPMIYQQIPIEYLKAVD